MLDKYYFYYYFVHTFMTIHKINTSVLTPLSLAICPCQVWQMSGLEMRCGSPAPKSPV